MRIGDAAAVEDIAAHGRRQQALGDGRARLGGIEVEGDVDLAIVEGLAHRLAVPRELLAMAPEQRIELVEIGPERCRLAGEIRFGDGLGEPRGIVGQLVERLLQESGAGEIRRGGIGESAGMGLGPGEQRRHAARRIRHPRRIVDEHDLGHAPGRLQTFHRHGEIHRRGRLSRDIHQTVARQHLGEGTEEQALALHGGEIGAVDPDEIDRAAIRFPGGLLRQHPGDRLAGIRELHLAQGDAVIGLKPPRRPGDEGVDLGIAAPGIEIDRLALGLGQGLAPARGRGIGLRRLARKASHSEEKQDDAAGGDHGPSGSGSGTIAAGPGRSPASPTET